MSLRGPIPERQRAAQCKDIIGYCCRTLVMLPGQQYDPYLRPRDAIQHSSNLAPPRRQAVYRFRSVIRLWAELLKTGWILMIFQSINQSINQRENSETTNQSIRSGCDLPPCLFHRNQACRRGSKRSRSLQRNLPTSENKKLSYRLETGRQQCIYL